jgi:hypothetical protein
MNTSKPKIKVQTPSCVLPHVSGSFKIVAEDGEFMFPKICPYCGGDLTYRPNGWEQDDEGLWMADSFDMDCSNEPSMDDEDEWEEWMRIHSDMPYVNQLPVDKAVKKWINKRFRFAVS